VLIVKENWYSLSVADGGIEVVVAGLAQETGCLLLENLI
jgi:hypothetical protein